METTQTTGLIRNTIDKFYTKDTVVVMCLNSIKKHIKILDNDLIVEPSAGNGSFISGIKSLSKHHIFYDLEPENAEIVKQDYLTYDYKIHSDKFNNIHAIWTSIIFGNKIYQKVMRVLRQFVIHITQKL